jgi:hypothetical protein
MEPARSGIFTHLGSAIFCSEKDGFFRGCAHRRGPTESPVEGSKQISVFPEVESTEFGSVEPKFTWRRVDCFDITDYGTREIKQRRCGTSVENATH